MRKLQAAENRRLMVSFGGYRGTIWFLNLKKSRRGRL